MSFFEIISILALAIAATTAYFSWKNQRDTRRALKLLLESNNHMLELLPNSECKKGLVTETWSELRRLRPVRHV